MEVDLSFATDPIGLLEDLHGKVEGLVTFQGDFGVTGFLFTAASVEEDFYRSFGPLDDGDLPIGFQGLISSMFHVVVVSFSALSILGCIA
jgi:hypothetical protein